MSPVRRRLYMGVGGAILATFVALPMMSGKPRQHSEPTALSRYDLERRPTVQWKLPNRLREISGLAMTADDRLLAHDDERAIIYELDLEAERIGKVFALGDPVVRADFEGVAVVGDTVYLVTSGGRLYETREVEDGAHARFNTYDTGVGSRCEVEGLAFEPDDRSLVLVCKTVSGDLLKGSVALFRWSIDRHALTPDSPLLIDRDAITDEIPGRSFNPSGIERHPDSGTYFVVAARQEVIVELSLLGDVLDIARLRGGTHRQAEGISFNSEGDLLLGDEGAGRRARLTIYRSLSR